MHTTVSPAAFLRPPGFYGAPVIVRTRWGPTDMRKWAIPIVIFFVAIPGIGVFMLLAAPAYTSGLLLPLALAAAATVGLILRGFRK
jgi:hypothetical protein